MNSFGFVLVVGVVYVHVMHVAVVRDTAIFGVHVYARVTDIAAAAVWAVLVVFAAAVVRRDGGNGGFL